MIPKNIDVRNAKANGTIGVLQKVTLKADAVVHRVTCNGNPIKAILASDVREVSCKFEKLPLKKLTDFALKPETHVCNIDLPLPPAMQITPEESEMVRMKMTQIPLLTNNATTGHKLQGATIPSMFVHCWRMEKNWAYVVLSRVKTLNGLHLCLPLPFN